MRPEQRDAVLDLALRKIAEGEFCARFGIDRDQVPGQIIASLSEARDEEDGELVEYAMILADYFECAREPAFRERLLDAYRDLLAHDWHQKHLDLVRAVQVSSDSRNLAPLVQAIALKPRLAYLDEDDDGAFYGKCLWALQLIGSPEAVDAIRRFSESAIPALRESALNRLARVDRS